MFLARTSVPSAHKLFNNKGIYITFKTLNKEQEGRRRMTRKRKFKISLWQGHMNRGAHASSYIRRTTTKKKKEKNHVKNLTQSCLHGSIE